MSKTNTEDLERFELRQSDDYVKRDLEVTCTDCGEVICDAEDEDTLGLLARVAEDHDCSENPNFGFPETYPDWRVPQEIVLGDYVETNVHGHRGRVFQVHPGYPAGLGCPESDAWLAGQQPTPLTEYKYARWVSILVHKGGSVVVPSDLAHRVEPFDFESDYANQYFRNTNG